MKNIYLGFLAVTVFSGCASRSDESIFQEAYYTCSSRTVAEKIRIMVKQDANDPNMIWITELNETNKEKAQSMTRIGAEHGNKYSYTDDVQGELIFWQQGDGNAVFQYGESGSNLVMDVLACQLTNL